MKKLGIKLADGSFHPIMEEEPSTAKALKITTSQDNQTTVHVDIYRGDDDSMENAEYVDTIEVSALNPHPEGEATLDLELSVDENNELHATVKDEETGQSGELKVNLIKRSDAERQEASVVLSATGEDTFENPLLSEENSADNDGEETKVIEPSPNSEEFAFDSVDTPAEDKLKKELDDTTATESVTEDTASTDFDLPDFDDDTTATEKVADDTASTDFDLPDFGDDTTTTESVAEDTASTDFDLPDFGDDTTTTESVAEDTASTDFDLPDFGDTTATESVTEDTSSTDFDLPDFGDDTTATESVTEDTSSTDFDLPDFGDTTATESVTEDTTSTDFDLPDFSADEGVVKETPVFDLPDFDDEKSDPISDDDLDFDLPDFGDDDTLTGTSADSSVNTNFNPQSSMFNDLYDDETREGNSANHDAEEDEEVSKKTRAPVIICIICAIICIIAVLMVLFVIPSKLNLFKKAPAVKEENTAVEVPAEEETLPPEPAVNELPPQEEEPEAEPVEKEDTVPAKEDEIVIATTPSAVVPEPPAPPAEKAPDIRYKVKWGDTLWDIANAYYKNPWRYHRIAKYNNISDPDHIVSGTWILIPAE